MSEVEIRTWYTVDAHRSTDFNVARLEDAIVSQPGGLDEGYRGPPIRRCAGS